MYFPTYDFIKETFKSRLVDFDYNKENIIIKEYNIFYEYNHPAVILEYKNIKFKCRFKYDTYFKDDNFWQIKNPQFSVSIDYSGTSREIRGIYYLDNYSELWIWPIVNIKIDLGLDLIKKSHIKWTSFGWGDDFYGFILNNKNGISSPEQVPFKIIESNDPDDDDLKNFMLTSEAKNININNGGMNL